MRKRALIIFTKHRIKRDTSILSALNTFLWEVAVDRGESVFEYLFCYTKKPDKAAQILNRELPRELTIKAFPYTSKIRKTIFHLYKTYKIDLLKSPIIASTRLLSKHRDIFNPTISTSHFIDIYSTV